MGRCSSGTCTEEPRGARRDAILVAALSAWPPAHTPFGLRRIQSPGVGGARKLPTLLLFVLSAGGFPDPWLPPFGKCYGAGATTPWRYLERVRWGSVAPLAGGRPNLKFGAHPLPP